MLLENIAINLDYLNASRLLLPSAETYTLALVGCGGTGSWLAPHVARAARLLVDKFQKRVNLLFVDPDVIEEKNCYRQNFSPAEIGQNKAMALAFRYALAWGLEITALAQPWKADQLQLESRDGPHLVVVIGCVDNAAARRGILEAVTGRWRNEPRTWWLDCGNHQAAGQVLVGCGSNAPKDAFALPGRCTWLPLPSDRHPELLEDAPAESFPEAEHLSCADLAMLDSQGLGVNARIAAEAADYLFRMLLTRDLTKRATYLDLAAGSARSDYIVKPYGEKSE